MVYFIALVVITLISSFSSALDTNSRAPIRDAELVGTWSSKSSTVETGPKFYDPVEDRLNEPRLPGISFSFTDDGAFESYTYVVVPDPRTPECPKAILTWQHGNYTIGSDASITLEPIKMDGRQLMSDPCSHGSSIYIRYNQTEFYKRYEVLMDGYRKKKRLNLFRYDGSPMNPMYLMYNPPQMLPTTLLYKPKTKATTDTKNHKIKRSLPLELKRKAESVDPDRVWWVGIAMTSVGLFGYLCF